MRSAICLALAALAACGPRTPTTTVAVFAPAAHETRVGALAEQRDATRVEERASRTRRYATTTTRPPVKSRATGPPGRTAVSARMTTTIAPPGGNGPGWQTAQASWYGPGFHGHHTACGQTYTPTIIGVAHRTLPCGTLITFQHNGTTITAPVIDRGPYVSGRLWDLSQGLCQRLGHCFTGPIRYRY